jgi:hypothetical protein
MSLSHSLLDLKLNLVDSNSLLGLKLNLVNFCDCKIYVCSNKFYLII